MVLELYFHSPNRTKIYLPYFLMKFYLKKKCKKQKTPKNEYYLGAFIKQLVLTPSVMY